MLELLTPTKLKLNNINQTTIAPNLIYQDKRVDFEIKKFKQNRWYAEKYGVEAYLEKLKELKDSRVKSLLFQDDSGFFWTYSGLYKYLQDKFTNGSPAKVNFDIPEAKSIPWATIPTEIPRPFQIETVEKLLAQRHAGVEIATGLGKTNIIRMLLKSLGIKSVIMAPSVSIAEQLLNDFTKHFGKKYVGQFFGGKKESKKLFVVAVSASLVKVELGSEHWDELSKAGMYIADESHLVAAATLAKVSLELLADVPYRFFFSGTQIRNDGLDLLLNAITGPIVYHMSVQEGVKQGFLAKPFFKILTLKSTSDYRNQDTNNMTRRHLFYNASVNALAADMANKTIELLDRPTLILIDEIEQFTHLLPYLKYKPLFAHGGNLSPEAKKKIPEEYWNSDPNALVKDFNDGKNKLLIGTSCISIGTDIKSVGSIIYLQGGKSEIQIRQAVGRGTRKVEGKDDCLIFDFDIENIPVLHKHAKIRKSIFQEIFPDVETLYF